MNIGRFTQKAAHIFAILFAIGMLSYAHAQGQSQYPERPIRLIVPFTPGGGTDAIARSLGERLGETLGTTVVIENRPGAGSTIGSDAVARSKPDGYTLLLASTAHVINPTLMPHLPYDTDKAFSAVALVGKAPNVIIVRPDSPLKSFADLIQSAKKAPGKLTYGSSGNGTSVHLAAEMLSRQADISLTHVPYKGAGAAFNDLMGGQINLLFATASAVAPAVRRGQVRALALTVPKRSAAWPDVPTVAESGYPDYAAEVWYAIYAAAGTPPEIIERLNKGINVAIQSPEFKRRTESEGLQSPTLTPAQVEAFTAEELEKWSKIVKQAEVHNG